MSDSLRARQSACEKEGVRVGGGERTSDKQRQQVRETMSERDNKQRRQRDNG